MEDKQGRDGDGAGNLARGQSPPPATFLFRTQQVLCMWTPWWSEPLISSVRLSGGRTGIRTWFGSRDFAGGR